MHLIALFAGLLLGAFLTLAIVSVRNRAIAEFNQRSRSTPAPGELAAKMRQEIERRAPMPNPIEIVIRLAPGKVSVEEGTRIADALGGLLGGVRRRDPNEPRETT